MRAAVVHEFHRPLVIEERPIPTPGPGQVLVKVEASGLCHTDIPAAHVTGRCGRRPRSSPDTKAWASSRASAPAPPASPRATGSRCRGWGWACGACEYCASGWETLCEKQRNTGYSVDGGFADYVVAEAAFVGHVPESIDPFDAAPLTCAGVTTYKAVKVSRTRPSDLVALFGIGGLGHLALQYAQIAGGTVPAVDVVDSKLHLAKELGATYTFDASTEDPADAIQALGGADAAIVLATNPRVFEQAFRSLRRNGRLVFVGLPADNEMRLPIFQTVLQGISVTGSIVGTRVDLAETFEPHVAGRTRVIRDQRSLEQVNEAMAEVEHGAIDARVVFDLGAEG